MQYFQRLIVYSLRHEQITLQVIKSKCLLALLCGLEACPLTKSDLQSRDFVINRFFIKLFTTKSIETVKLSRVYITSTSLHRVYIMGQTRIAKWSASSNVFVCGVIIVSIWLDLYSVRWCLYHGCYGEWRYPFRTHKQNRKSRNVHKLSVYDK